jgi:hypothetical protein
MSKQVLLEECIPSIMNNIWCYPTSRVLTISCVQYFGERFEFIYEVIFSYLQRNIIFGNKALSLAKERKKFFVLFVDFF